MTTVTDSERDTADRFEPSAITERRAGEIGAGATDSWPIRVAYVVHTFHVGGLERCVARLASSLDRRRFAPVVVCLNRNDDASRWVADDVPILEIGKQPGNDPLAVWRLARLLRRERIDIVHSHNWGTLVETAVARRLARTPIHVHAERGMELEDIHCDGWRRAARDRVKRLAMRSADAVIAVSESIRERLAERSVMPPERVEVIANGVERPLSRGDAARKRIRDRLRVPEDAVLIGSVGRLAPVKDFETLLRAVCELVGLGHDAHLALIGGGSEHEKLNALRRELRIDALCHLVGQQSNVGDWLSAMDVYVNCSVNEGMSQSVLDAMAVGKPLVVTDVGDSARLVGGAEPCGLVLRPRQPEALAEALESLILDPVRRSALAEAARRRHGRLYGAETMIARYEDLYQRLALNSPRRREGTTRR